VVVFFSKGSMAGKDVVLPTEMGLSTPQIEAAVAKRLQRQADTQPKPVFDVAHSWF
jgi:predicted naringenin-chalcone synthase